MSTTAQAITQESFGRTQNGEPVEVYTLRNAVGAEARITNYGGIVISLKMPDRGGRFADVVLGYDSLAGYESDTAYFGCIAGRYANRIAHGRFTLDGKTYHLATNDGPNHLHGGNRGFSKRVWQAEPRVTFSGPALELTYLSPDGEEGYPGDLSVTAIYSLTDANELRLDLMATSDKPTIVNLTQHSYFNLAGAGRGNILNHEVTIFADRYVAIDATSIPTGELVPVSGTPFDFTQPAFIGSRIEVPDPQLLRAKGYDHTFVLARNEDHATRLASRVSEPTSGRVLKVLTTQPAMQFYSGNYLNQDVLGKGGATYDFRSGFCMEPQSYPDSPNHPQFPTTVLRPGETYRETITYRFSTGP